MSISMLNMMAIRKHVSKKTLLDDVDVGPSKWHICGRALNGSSHEGMNTILNVYLRFI